MKKVLVLFNDDWADEMDMNGFSIMREDQWNWHVSALKASAYPVELYFGTNESNEYNSAEEIIRCYTVKAITDEEAEVITNEMETKIVLFATTLRERINTQCQINKIHDELHTEINK